MSESILPRAAEQLDLFGASFSTSIELASAAEGDEEDDAPFGSWEPRFYLPEAKTFGDLFEGHAFGRKPGAERRRGHPNAGPGGYIEQYCSVTSHEEDPRVWGMDVRPTPAAAAVLMEMYGVVDDPDLYFEITVRAPDDAIVVVKYNRINGNRWLAIIDPRTIPRSPRDDRGDEPASVAPATPSSREARIAELLGQMKVTGNLATFGGTKRIADWGLLKAAMTDLGGKWVGGRTQGFQFGPRVNLGEVIAAAIATGKRTTAAREAHFVASPRDVAERVVDLVDVSDRDRVLEPSAGHGAIADVVRQRAPSADLVLCELLDDNREVLVAKGYGEALIEERDFMCVELDAFDVVVMNPPFKDEIAHVTRAFRMLKPGGRLASVMSGGIAFRKDAAAKAFREFVEEHGRIEDLPEGSFRESGTNVATVVVYLERPLEALGTEAAPQRRRGKKGRAA